MAPMGMKGHDERIYCETLKGKNHLGELPYVLG
jgi:hypothetical protein